MPALFDRSMPSDFSVIAADRVDLDDERLRRRLHGGVNKSSPRGMVKTGEWGKFDRHIHSCRDDLEAPNLYCSGRTMLEAGKGMGRQSPPDLLHGHTVAEEGNQMIRPTKSTTLFLDLDGLKAVVVGTEGREPNAYRMRRLWPDGFEGSFVSSCLVHVRKPDAYIFRPPARQAVYIENTPMFVETAEALGARRVLPADYRPMCSKPVSFRLRNDEGVIHETG